MTWWTWTLLWLLLVIGALGVLFLVGRSLWRKGMDLAHDLGEASERFARLSDQLSALQPVPEPADEPAVFADPARLRAERHRARTGRR